MGGISKALWIIVATVAIVMVSADADAQCCGPGNPISVTGAENNAKRNHLQIMMDYRHSFSDTYYEGSSKYKDEFFGMLRSAEYDYLNLGISYGITKRWTVQTGIGYYINRSEDFRLEALPDAEISGLGDLLVSTSYNVWRDSKRGIELTPFVSVKFPVGKFDSENNGVKLPLSMQPSSGTTKYSGGFYLYSNLSRKFYFTSYNQFEFSQRFDQPRLKYKYGNLLYLNNAFFYKAIPWMTVGLAFSYEHAYDAHDEKMPVPGTSYKLLKTVPQIMINPLKSTHVMVSFDYPLWRQVDMVQMSNKWALQLKFMHDINLN